MVKCPICGEDFDSERGMKIHKTRVHTQENDEEYIKNLEKKETMKYLEWRPEIAMVTIVGIISIILLLAVASTSINQLDHRMQELEQRISEGEPRTYTPTKIDQAICDIGAGANIIYQKMFYCEETTLCTPSGDNHVKILAIQAINHEASTKQREILKELEEEITGLEVEYYCASQTHLTCDWGEMYEDSEISQYYTIEEAPTLIINCEYKRLGTYAASNPQREKQELAAVINAFKTN